MPLSLKLLMYCLMFHHLSMVNIIDFGIYASLFLGFLMTALNMDSHCPWILCVDPLLHLGRCIYYFPVKTHPCCSHSPSCHLLHFLLLLYIWVLNLSFKIWLRSQLETTGIYFYESVDIYYILFSVNGPQIDCHFLEAGVPVRALGLDKYYHIISL